MTLNVQTWPTEWYQYVVSNAFVLRSMNQRAGRPWGGAGAAVSARPHTQIWTERVTLAPMRDPLLQDIDAFIADAKGSSGLIRMSNTLRLAPWADRKLAGGEWPPGALSNATTSRFSDGSGFDDGSGFANGFGPSAVQIYQAAARGANYIVLSGFPASTANVLRRGDLVEVKPGGVAAEFPHLYKAMLGGNSDASGRVGIRIESPLRASVNAGDTASLRYASTLFRFSDDNQGDVEGSDGGQGAIGFSLIEALDLVP